MKSQRLPDTEFEIMTYIWDREPPVTTTMVMEALGRARGWKIQTVVTLFARLTERGFLRVERGSGRERRFIPSSRGRNTCAWKRRALWSTTTATASKAC